MVLSFHLEMQLFYSCAVNVYMCMICGPQSTYGALTDKVEVELTGHNVNSVQLHIAILPCIRGSYQYRPRVVDKDWDTTIDGRDVVCRPCSQCDDGVETLSECTQSQDVRCSKRCVNPSFIYDEGTKSCQSRAVLAGNGFGGIPDHDGIGASQQFMSTSAATNVAINRMPTKREWFLDRNDDLQQRFTESVSLNKKGNSRRHSNVGAQHNGDGDGPVPKVILKDPKVLFAASGVIFTFLLIMMIPQAFVKLRRQWRDHRSHRPGPGIEQTRYDHNINVIAVNGATPSHQITTEMDFSEASSVPLSDSDNDDSLSDHCTATVKGSPPIAKRRESLDIKYENMFTNKERYAVDDGNKDDVDDGLVVYTEYDDDVDDVDDDNNKENQDDVDNDGKKDGLDGGIVETIIHDDVVEDEPKETKIDVCIGQNDFISQACYAIGAIEPYMQGSLNLKSLNTHFITQNVHDNDSGFASDMSSPDSSPVDNIPRLGSVSDNTFLVRADINCMTKIKPEFDQIVEPGYIYPNSSTMAHCSDRILMQAKGHGRPPSDRYQPTLVRQQSCGPGYAVGSVAGKPERWRSVNLGEENPTAMVIVDQPRSLTRQMSFP